MKKWVLILLALAAVSVAAYLYPRHESRQPWSTQEPKSTKPPVAVIEGLNSCIVCGYKALDKKGNPCQNCNVVATKATADSLGMSYAAFLQMEQLNYFSRDTVNFVVDLYGPKVTEKGYPKDPDWKPQPFVNKGSVTEFLRIRVTELKDLNTSLQ